MTVRRVRPTDAAELRQIRLAALTDAPSAFGSTHAVEVDRTDAEWTQRVVDASHGNDRALFFAELEGETVGLVGGYRERPSDRTVELVSMWVAPAARREGVGVALIDAVREWAAGAGATRLALWVTSGNGPAERLYEAAGFVATGERQPHPAQPSLDETRMERALVVAR